MPHASNGISARAKFNIIMAVVALAALMVVTCSITKDAPHLAEDGVAPSATVLEREVVLQDLDEFETAGPAITTINHKLVKQLHENAEVEPLQEDEVLRKEKVSGLYEQQLALFQQSIAKDEEGRLDRLGADLDATEDSLVKKAKPEKEKSAKPTTTVQGGAASTVQQALKAAANAKVQAMAAQQRALIAGTKAKSAAAKAAQAPMTPAGQEVVKAAQQEVAEAKIDVDAAKVALGSLAAKKAKAAKAILDAAGGKYSHATGYAGQGGYFGAALRTAFKNGQLSKELEHQKWKSGALKVAEKKSFDKGEETGYEQGLSKGVKEGERKELPKAVARAEVILKQKKKDEAKAKITAKNAAESASLNAAAKKEASKVRKVVEAEAAADKVNAKK